MLLSVISAEQGEIFSKRVLGSTASTVLAVDGWDAPQQAGSGWGVEG